MKSLLFVAVAVMSVNISAAVDYHVAVDGDDTNDGLTPATAKATIAGGYVALTNGAPEATFGNRLVIGEGVFDLPAFTTVLSNGWKVVGAGKGRTTLKVTKKTRQFTLASDDTELRGLRIDFIGSKMDMAKDVDDGNADLYGALALNPEGTLADLDVANYYTGWSGTLLHISAAGVSPVVSNCVFRNFHIHYRTPLVRVGNVAASPLFTHCAFIDGTCNKYWTPGTIYMDGNGATTTIRNCLFLRCENYQDHHWDKYRTATIHCNSKTTIENCSIINCTFRGEGFDKGYEAWADRCGPIIKAGKVVNTLVYGCTNSNGELQPCREGTYSYCANDAALLSGEGNIRVEPGGIRFQNEAGDFFMPAGGPTIDAGAELDWTAGATDVRGLSRVTGARPDIGCYEYHAPRTIYVAKDGDDANDGLTRATAKATIPAGYAAMTAGTRDENYCATLVVGDGEWTSAEIGGTIVLSNGWSLVGENGRESTVFKTTGKNFIFFAQKTADTTVRGITFDFNRASFVYETYAVRDPQGTIADCEFRNEHGQFVGSGLVALMGLGMDGNCAPVIDNCVFRNVKNIYNGASSICGSSKAKGFLISNCAFIDCEAGTDSFSGGGTLFFYCSVGTVRNCLFLRSVVNGAKSSAYGSNCSVVSAGVSGAKLTVENCSFVDCRIKRNSQAGAVGLSGGNTTLTVRNCLSSGCVNDAGPVGFVTNVTANSVLRFSHCASEVDTLKDNGNILFSAGDIVFRRPSKGDCTVRRGPTINAGELLSWHTGAKDLLGRDRVIGSAPDIGAFEYDFVEKATYIMLR